jgi:hypothetical protein
MPPEEVGVVLEVDGVPVEFSRYRFGYVPRRVAAMMRELLKKEYVNAQCDNPEYKDRMTCSKMVYIPKRKYLIAVSNIKSPVEIKDNGCRLVALNYEATPEEDFRKVIDRLERLQEIHTYSGVVPLIIRLEDPRGNQCFPDLILSFRDVVIEFIRQDPSKI